MSKSSKKRCFVVTSNIAERFNHVHKEAKAGWWVDANKHNLRHYWEAMARRVRTHSSLIYKTISLNRSHMT
jgi:hypothetical protein